MRAAENVVVGMGAALITDSFDGKLDQNYGVVFVTSFVAGGVGGGAAGAITRNLPSNATLGHVIRQGGIEARCQRQ